MHLQGCPQHALGDSYLPGIVLSDPRSQEVELLWCHLQVGRGRLGDVIGLAQGHTQPAGEGVGG